MRIHQSLQLMNVQQPQDVCLLERFRHAPWIHSAEVEERPRDRRDRDRAVDRAVERLNQGPAVVDARPVTSHRRRSDFDPALVRKETPQPRSRAMAQYRTIASCEDSG
jgi:hypothetical protein